MSSRRRSDDLLIETAHHLRVHLSRRSDIGPVHALGRRALADAAIPSVAHHDAFLVVIPVAKGREHGGHDGRGGASGDGHFSIQVAVGAVAAGSTLNGHGGLRGLDIDDGSDEGHLLAPGEVGASWDEEGNDGAGGLWSAGLGRRSRLGGGRRGDAEEDSDGSFGVHYCGLRFDINERLGV